MKIAKSIQLTTKPLEDLLAQEISIDFRLDQPAWANLKPGDALEFWEDFSGWDQEPSPHSRRVVVILEDIFRARTFTDLIDDLPASFAERGSKDDIISGLRKWWTPEREQEIGVLGFKIRNPHFIPPHPPHASPSATQGHPLPQGERGLTPTFG